MFNFLMKKMLKSKLQGVPEAEQEKLFAMIEKNPEFFKKVAEEVQAKVSSGKDQMAAVMEVMQNHKSEMESIQKELK